MDVRHQHPIKVRFYELDPYGHLNHSVYVQLFETGRVELLDQIGLGLHALQDQGYQFVVSKIETKFLAPGVGGDELIIETSLTEMRRASSRWFQRILRDDQVLATQEVLAAVTNDQGRPVRCPDFITEALLPFLAGPQ